MKEKQPALLQRQRKMLLVMPLLVLPFITFAFWALGGGKGIDNKASQDSTGLNLRLPDAKLKDEKNADKLSFYNEADADSMKRRQVMSNDPYYKDMIAGLQDRKALAPSKMLDTIASRNGLNTSTGNASTDASEQRIYQKINELNKQINQPEAPQTISKNLHQQIPSTSNTGDFSNDVDRLQSMMHMANEKPEADPEMQQLNGTLEKIMDIQNPDRVREKVKEASLKNKQQAFAVSKQSVVDNVSLLDTGKTINRQNGFYSLEKTASDEAQNTVEAVVHEAQVLLNGSVVKMRLLDDMYVNGTLIPKGNFVFGTTQLNDERLEVSISSIRCNNSLFPVKLDIYDMDGLPGIYIPGAISRDVAKQSADNSLQLMELTSMDPSLKAQAATGGITAAKSSLRKKVKQVKVLVKAGYKILLMDKSTEQ